MDQACAGPRLGSDRGARNSWGAALLRACAELRPTERCLRCARDARGVCERGWFALTFSLNIHTGVMDPVKRTMPAWRWRRGAIRGPRSALHRALGWYIDGGPETIGISAAVVLRGRLTSLSLWCAAWRVGVCWWDWEWCDCEFLLRYKSRSLARDTHGDTPYFVLTTTNAYRKSPISTS